MGIITCDYTMNIEIAIIIVSRKNILQNAALPNDQNVISTNPEIYK